MSPGIVFAWESGRSVPRRKAIIIRLRRLLATQPEPTRGRVLKLTAKRRTALRLQGQYMGQLRSHSATQKAKVKKAKAARGFAAAIKLAKKLRRA